MECNRDEAVRAKEIAQQKFEANDYLGAKKFALKSQSLYPGLDGIQHMLRTLNVYISSENRVNGESDWYKILDVDPYEDEETIKKQYRKLALVLHPDKNKSIGADGAFKLITEAWKLLSDKTKRSMYDQKRNFKVVKPTAPPHGSNGVSGPKKRNTTPKTGAQKGKAAQEKSTAPNGTTATPNQQKHPITPTFWSVCHRCRLQHKYLCMYLHKNIYCPGCKLPYYTQEYPPPSPQILKMAGQSNYFQLQQAESTSWFSGSYPSNQTNSQWNPFQKVDSGPYADQAATMAQQSFEKSKREREDVLNAMSRERKNLASKSDGESPSDLNASKRRKLVEDKRGKTKTMITVKENGRFNDSIKGKHRKLLTISIPDSDFYDFDNDRKEMCFNENQVWAAYDDDDGMPRYYAIIHNVVSVSPFKVRISWLNSPTSTELGLLNWVGPGFAKTCGQFRIGKMEINESLSLDSFSHKVKLTKGGLGLVSVFPKKGDVWALFRNWSPKWNEFTEDKVIHEYVVVEVLEDYDEVLGVKISPLIKVAGFNTVFHRNWDKAEIKMIPSKEIFRFSHQIPSFLFSGQEGENAPKGCHELDPAATPVQLLQVTSDSKGKNRMGDEGVIVLD